MKLIDVLQMIADEELEEGTEIRIKGDNLVWYFDGLNIASYNGEYDSIFQKYNLSEVIDFEVEIIPKVAENEQKSSKIAELKYLGEDYSLRGVVGKLNEAIRYINNNHFADVGKMAEIKEIPFREGLELIKREAKLCDEESKCADCKLRKSSLCLNPIGYWDIDEIVSTVEKLKSATYTSVGTKKESDK